MYFILKNDDVVDTCITYRTAKRHFEKLATRCRKEYYDVAVRLEFWTQEDGYTILAEVVY